MTLALTVLLLVALMVARDYAREHAHTLERDQWTRERGQLLDRIKPETAQGPQGPLESFPPLPLDGPQADDLYWEDKANA